MTNAVQLTKVQAVAVAIDAVLDGRWSMARAALAQVGARFTKPQAKQLAKALLSQGRIAESLRVLTTVYGLESALVEIQPPPSVEVGAIFVCSWGYDQTNVDYYQVVRVSGSRVTIRAIGASQVDASHTCPTSDAFIGVATIHRLQNGYRGEPCIHVNGHSAHAWSGKPEYSTPSGYGH
jgi:hypothetical protein